MYVYVSSNLRISPVIQLFFRPVPTSLAVVFSIYILEGLTSVEFVFPFGETVNPEGDKFRGMPFPILEKGSGTGLFPGK